MHTTKLPCQWPSNINFRFKFNRIEILIVFIFLTYVCYENGRPRIKRISAETADDAVIVHCFETLIKNKKEDFFLIIIRVHVCKGQQLLPSPKCNEPFFDFIKSDHLCEPSSIWNICRKFHLLLKSTDCSVETKKNVPQSGK